jgi:outer membrane biosynthesis protein TonB
MNHPSIDELRLLAEDPRSEAAAHVASCERCRGLVDLARKEELALRAAIPAEPPRDLVERTLRAVDAESPRGAARPRTRPPGPPVGLLVWVVVGVAGLIAIYALNGTAVPPGPGTEPVPAPVPAPEVTPAPAPAPLPASGPTPPEPSAPVMVPIPETAPPEPAPETSLAVVAENPKPAPSETPSPETRAPETQRETRALAVLRSGKLTRNGVPVAPGAAVNDGALVATTACELEAAGVVALSAPANARFALASGEAGELVARIEKGGLQARSLGHALYRVATTDFAATPSGTVFAVWLEGARTHVATFEGSVQVAGAVVRAGFEVELAKGKPAPLPHPIAKAPSWTSGRAPKIELVRSFAFEGDREGWTVGDLAATGAHGSRGALRGAPHTGDYGTVVEIEDTRTPVLTTDPDLWIEATVKVDRKTRVVLQFWDADRKENVSRFATVEPGVWTTVASPLRDFGAPDGKPRSAPIPKGDRSTCFSVYAGEGGEKVELLVDDVRFYFER